MTTPEAQDPLSAALDAAADKAFGTTTPAESVAESDTLAGQEPPSALQGGVEENPESVAPADLAKAWQEIGRAKGKYGTEPAGIAGKSEAELVALGTELETLRRQEDRDHAQRAQGDSTPPTGDEDPGSAGAVGTDTPAKLEALLTSLKDEGLDEAAAQLEGLIGGQQSQLDALTARLDGDAQARQLAPIQEAVDEVFAGVKRELPDLSTTQREGLMTLAAQIGNANPAKYEKMSPAERVQYTLSQAIEVTHGVKPVEGSKAPARPAQRRTAEPAANGNVSGNHVGKPTNMSECLDQAADKAFENWKG